MLNLRDKIELQIEDIKNEQLFKALHFRGHALFKHVASDEQMKRAIIEERRPVNECDIVMVTRFFNKESALSLIADALSENIDDIVNWLLSNIENDLVVTLQSNKPTGEGLVKNADWGNFIPVHGVNVVIRKDFSSYCKSFLVVTAYPVRVFEDVDAIYDAIDAFSEKM